MSADISCFDYKQIWARVRYCSDNTTADVPISFFRDRGEVEPELRISVKQLREKYVVFWSPNHKESPLSFMTTQGKIVEAYKKRKTLIDDVAGWYHAEILFVSLVGYDDLLAKVDAPETRTRPKTKKVPCPTTPEKDTKKMKREQRKSLENARQENLKRTLNNGSQEKVEESPIIPKTAEFPEEADASSASIEKIKAERDALADRCSQMEAELAAANKRIAGLVDYLLEGKCGSLECAGIVSNNGARKTLFGDFNNGGLQLVSSTPKQSHSQMSVESEQFVIQTDDGASLGCIADNVEFIDQHGNNLESFMMSDVDEASELTQKSSQEPACSQDQEDANSADYSGIIGGIRLPKEDFKCRPPEGCLVTISYQQFMEIAKSVKPGEFGDSQFVKNLAEVMWPGDALTLRSASGKACPSQKGSVARPECTPSKKQYIQDLLTVRLKFSVPTVQNNEIVKRTSEVIINKYLRQKIKAKIQSQENAEKKRAAAARHLLI